MALFQEKTTQDRPGEKVFPLGIRTTYGVEWAWAAGRLAVAGTVALGAVAQLRESPAYVTLLGILAFAFAYDIVLMMMLLQRRLARAFIAGTALDNATLLAGWWIVARSQEGTGQVTDLYLVLFPVLIVGVARLGSRIGPFYTGFWLAWLVWATIVYEGPGSYELEQLLLRILFMATVAGITIRIVSRLEQERNRAESALEALNEEHAEGRRRVEAFQSAADGMVLEQDQVQSFQRLLDNVRSLLNLEYADVVVWGSDGEVSRVVRSGNPERGGQAATRELQGLVSPVLAELRQGSIVHDRMPQAIHRDGYVALPLACKDGSSGVLKVGTGRGRVLGVEDLQLLNLFALLTRVLIENANLYARLATEQETLGTIQASMLEGLLVVGPDRQIRYMNGAAGELATQDAEALLGRPVLQFLEALAGASDDPSLAEQFTSILEGKESLPFSFAVHLARPESRYLNVDAFEIPAAGAPMTGFLLRDTTEERELEERRNAFVSIASHELRTPMTSLVGFSELLLNRPVSDEKRDEWLRTIHQESLRLTQILEDMLNVSRMHSKGMDLHIEPIDLGEVVHGVVEMTRLTTSLHTITADLPGDLPVVLADRDKLVQVLVNFTSNAVKYSPSGGNVRVRAWADAASGKVVVAVSDEGIGIAREDLRKLFSTFQRVRAPETAGIRGTGLGLYIVKNLVDLMGGEVWVESELGKGSTFSFSVPTVAASPQKLATG